MTYWIMQPWPFDMMNMSGDELSGFRRIRAA